VVRTFRAQGPGFFANCLFLATTRIEALAAK
jgi:hypothetical protein